MLTATFMVFHAISASFRREYPDPFKSLLELGLLTEEESHEIQIRVDEFNYIGELTSIPISWACKVASQSFEEGQWHCTAAGHSTEQVLGALRDYRAVCGVTMFQIYLAFPISLTQVVTVGLYMHLCTLLVAAQNTHKDNEPVFCAATSRVQRCM